MSLYLTACVDKPCNIHAWRCESHMLTTAEKTCGVSACSVSLTGVSPQHMQAMSAAKQGLDVNQHSAQRK
eukprot:5828644-Amphidinium_carterae.2